MEAKGAKLLPFYIVIDASYSMSGRKIRSANEIIKKVRDALAQDPILADKVRIGLVDFADDARVQLELCDVLEPSLSMPVLEPRGGTSYVAAFRLLRSTIAANIKLLKGDGFKVHRPAVFFLSDGAPTDPVPEWKAAFADLVGDEAYPNVITFGVDDADAHVLQSLIHPSTGSKQMRMYLMDNGEDAAKAITAMAEIMISSVLQSGHSLSQGETGIVLPDEAELPSGITSHAAADDDFV
ncbi:VWA domain-containing protein [Amycolatopsis sp. CA-128772]|uniref:vWA domain-containing protein n=1 Tax=Amycolatopsis sp. CA-128772 TaxID=2073159 RepID=UPI000CD2874B|nr:VWA domain-containing protein [Amycolatopsis sp. CA-128772]